MGLNVKNYFRRNSTLRLLKGKKRNKSMISVSSLIEKFSDWSGRMSTKVRGRKAAA